MRTVRAVGLGLLILAGFGGGRPAPAQTAPGPNFIELFQQLDANGDRVVDRGEVPESGKAAFETLLKNGDSNHDGRLDADEYRRMLGSLRDSIGAIGNRFNEMDKNGDGKISKDEFMGPPLLFGRLDANNDGFLSKDEAARSRPGAGTGPAGAGLGPRLRAMDQNGDGKISKDEFRGPPQLFDRLDRNSDGFLSGDEMPRVNPAAAKSTIGFKRLAPAGRGPSARTPRRR
jgi:Ca2+-binding EF-hand superfamily protein